METSPTIVFQSVRRRDCAERALVLRALNIEHGTRTDGSTWVLWVYPQDVERVLVELRSYEAERRSEGNRPSDPPVLDYGLRNLVLYGVLLGAFFPVGLYGLFGENFWMLGRMDSTQVAQGEWWRTITSLCLHADLAHLAGNVVFGALFAGLTSQLLGSGLTWLATVLAGSLGNAMTTLIHGPGHLAIGASTAVFGTLGLFAFYEWVRRRRDRAILGPVHRMRIIAPLMAGAVLFGFLG
ncbi:MAG TPA: rhomboid family intramembrane serine protease, partial [Planctomycetota bacterium]|nr:rhomboid family intramembrane serine protease [Planctomycetota bacterium]